MALGLRATCSFGDHIIVCRGTFLPWPQFPAVNWPSICLGLCRVICSLFCETCELISSSLLQYNSLMSCICLSSSGNVEKLACFYISSADGQT